MPDVKEEKGKFVVIVDDENKEFDSLEAARDYIAEDVDEDQWEDVVMYRYTTKYTVNSSKKILFSKSE